MDYVQAPKWRIRYAIKTLELKGENMNQKTKIARYEFLCKWLIKIIENRRSPLPKYCLRGVIELMKVEME